MEAVVTCKKVAATTSATTSCRKKRVWILLFLGFSSDLWCLHASWFDKKKGHQKGLDPSGLEKSHSEAVVVSWMREIIGCIFSSMLRSMEIPIGVLIAPWTPWMLALESAEKNLQFSFVTHTDEKLVWDQNETQSLLIKGTKISFRQGSYLGFFILRVTAFLLLIF